MRTRVVRKFLWWPAQVLNATLTYKVRWLKFVWRVECDHEHTRYVETERIATAYAFHVRQQLRTAHDLKVGREL